jgi:hypothetical protein
MAAVAMASAFLFFSICSAGYAGVQHFQALRALRRNSTRIDRANHEARMAKAKLWLGWAQFLALAAIARAVLPI